MCCCVLIIDHDQGSSQTAPNNSRRGDACSVTSSQTLFTSPSGVACPISDPHPRRYCHVPVLMLLPFLRVFFFNCSSNVICRCITFRRYFATNLDSSSKDTGNKWESDESVPFHYLYISTMNKNLLSLIIIAFINDRFVFCSGQWPSLTQCGSTDIKDWVCFRNIRVT